MLKKIVFLLFISFCLTSCMQISFAPSRQNYSPNKIASADQIEVYRTEIPQKPYSEIGAISVSGGGDLEAKVAKMKAEASNRGGNAIIDLRVIPTGVVGTVVSINE